jgi:hypothetical protein
MVMVVRQSAMDLARAEMRMLALDLVGIPVVSQPIERDFDDLRLRTGDIRHAGSQLDMSVGKRGHSEILKKTQLMVRHEHR